MGQTVAWEASGSASADAFCATKYDATATCADFSSEWQTQDGRSIFCPNGGSVDDGGCHHTVFCCACNGDFCDEDACNVGKYVPDDDSTGSDSGRRLLEHLEDDYAENDNTSTHIELGSSHLHMGITGHGQIHLDNTLMFEGSNTILHVRHHPRCSPHRVSDPSLREILAADGSYRIPQRVCVLSCRRWTTRRWPRASSTCTRLRWLRPAVRARPHACGWQVESVRAVHVLRHVR